MVEKSAPEVNKTNRSKTIRVFAVFMMIMFLIGGVSGFTYAKYLSSWSSSTSAMVASFGVIDIREHEVIEKDGEYVFSDKEKSIANSSILYDSITPGVPILKDPFVVISGTFDVRYELHLTVEKINFPDTITFSIMSGWKNLKTLSNNKIEYIYNGNIEIDKPIYILEDNKLTVDETFSSEGVEFRLTFSAWIEQVD